MDKVTFFKNLKSARKNARYSQAEVGERLGVKQTTVGQWERGLRNPSIDNLIKLGDLYGVDFLKYSGTGDGQKRSRAGGDEAGERIKEVLLKQMELLQEESKKVNSGLDKPHDLAIMSSAMAELATACAKVDAIEDLDGALSRISNM